MSFLFNPPTSLSGAATNYNVALSWTAPNLINGPALLLHFDGTNGQQSAVDSSGNGNTVLFNTAGGAAITTSNPKFGTGSFATSSSSYLNSYAIAVPYALGGPLDIFTGNSWTIEGWVLMTDITSTPMFVAVFNTTISGSGNPTFQIFASLNVAGTSLTVEALNTGLFAGTNGQSVSASVAASLNTWHHFAVVNNSGTTTMYLDGVAGSPTEVGWNPAAYTPNSNPYITIGSWVNFSGGRDTGQIDELTLWNIAKYTSNFTPPTAPYIVTPVGYDVYRNGVSVATYTGPTGYTDVGLSIGSYTYQVAAWDGVSADSSNLSSPITVNVVGYLPPKYAKFVQPKIYVPTLLIDAKGIKPRVYMPKENVTVKT